MIFPFDYLFLAMAIYKVGDLLELTRRGAWVFFFLVILLYTFSAYFFSREKIKMSFDPEKLIPSYLLKQDVKGKIQGTSGKFTYQGTGSGVYEYKTMEWTSEGSHGNGYQMVFSYNRQGHSPRLSSIPKLPAPKRRKTKMIQPNAWKK